MDPLAVGGLVFTILGVIVAIYYGQRSLRGQLKAGGYQVTVTVTNGFPVYDLPDGSQKIEDHYVMLDVVNVGDRPITITGWGIKLPGEQRMVVTQPTNWTTRLPHVLRPGEPPAHFAVIAEALREANRERGIAYRKMRPYVQLADGKEVLANKHVPLA